MCLENNQCSNKNNYGDLCFECIDNDGNQVVSKNGIQCCSKFIGWLIIPIILIYLIFGLILSYIKYTVFNSLLCKSILFIQINSVIFFPYSGIYFLPLFRGSLDMIDGICLSKNLNYIGKVYLSYLIIILLFIIGSTDITIKLFIKIYQIFFKKSKESTVLPNFIVKILIRKKQYGEFNYKMKSLFSLFQILLIPLLFNSISMLVKKNILYNTTRLIMDFSIINSSNRTFLQIISILLLIIIGFFILLVVLIFNLKTFLKLVKKLGLNLKFIEKFKLQSKLIQILNTDTSNSIYRNQFKWWNVIEIIRSIIFSILSISMIFSPNYYMLIIVSIQFIYTFLYIFFEPLQKKYYFKNILINFSQLIIFTIFGSSLFQTLILPFFKGLIISILSFLVFIIIIFFKKINKNK